MRAAVVKRLGQAPVVTDRPIPEPGVGQVLVEMEASGLCHADIHAALGDWPDKPAPPFIPGHEGAGRVKRRGPGVTDLRPGDLVAVTWLGHACGHCEQCLRGWETLCADQENTGYTIDGCHAEYFLAEAPFAVKVPPGIDPREAAVLSCAGLAAYKAVKVGKVGPTDLVAVSGIGALGHLAVQYAKLSGATVAAIDIDDEKLRLAAELGADILVDARTQDPTEVLRSHGGADVALALTVDEKAFPDAYNGLRRGGRLVLSARPAAAELNLPVLETVLNGISIIGSTIGTRADLADVFALHADGRTRVVYEDRRLLDIDNAIDDLLQGHTSGRVVLHP